MRRMFTNENSISASENDVFVFSALLSQLKENFQLYFSLLNEPEKQRSFKFKSETAKSEFVLSRGFLREKICQILGHANFEILTDNFGKPRLSSQHNWLKFNLSHSGDRVVVAFTKDCPIGIDIEKINYLQNLEVAKQVFSQSEMTQLEGLTGPQKVRGFFKGWTQKEAFIKANGQGMSYPLKSFSVLLDPETGASLLHNEHEVSDKVSGEMKSLDIDPDYSCTLFVLRPKVNVILSA